MHSKIKLLSISLLAIGMLTLASSASWASGSQIWYKTVYGRLDAMGYVKSSPSSSPASLIVGTIQGVGTINQAHIYSLDVLTGNLNFEFTLPPSFSTWYTAILEVKEIPDANFDQKEDFLISYALNNPTRIATSTYNGVNGAELGTYVLQQDYVYGGPPAIKYPQYVAPVTGYLGGATNRNNRAYVDYRGTVNASSYIRAREY